jgi:S-adenosyl-L-methionine hydrolase (adenosine-forming)
MGAIITLTSDFGLTDAYVAAMKGVILGINPDARLVDISHTIDAQDIHTSAFILSTVYRYFPPNTIHLVVVDPGVGSERRAIALKTPGAHFVAPDNGVLSYILQDYQSKKGVLSKGLEAVSLTNHKYWRRPISDTFHGRDIFAPVAAYLSLGISFSELGDNIKTISTLPIYEPYVGVSSVSGNIVHIDRFGNLITNIEKDMITGTSTDMIVHIRNRKIKGLSRNYSEAQGLLALFDSTGRLEIALSKGDARQFLGANIGDKVSIQAQGENRK